MRLRAIERFQSGGAPVQTRGHTNVRPGGWRWADRWRGGHRATPGPLFCCTEIRQRGPVPATGAACLRPCGIAKVMHHAERAGRQELASTTIADLVETSGTAVTVRVSIWLATLRQAS